MNNYWETNYAAAQEGPCTFRYVIRPHEGFDPAMAEKEAIGQRQPLLSRKGGGWQKEKEPLAGLKNKNLVITALKPADQGKDILVTVYNAGQSEEIPDWSTEVKSVTMTDPDGLKEVKAGQIIPPAGIRYFRLALTD
jgi:alpha-mannosidase